MSMYSLFSELIVRSTFPLGVMMKITCVVIGLALALGATSALGQSNPRYVQFRPSATKGALYAPDSGPAPTVAFLAIHRTSNFMNMISTRELARRGFMVLGMNPRSDNNEAIVNFEDIALDIKQGVEFLRRQPGISRVILIGFSGGGPSTTFYQATAEKGPSYCQGPNKLTQCSNALVDLPPADGLLLLDASLDPFDARNGFNSNGQSAYSAEFVDRYFKAQAARMNRLIDKALSMRETVKQGTGSTTDDAPFIFYRNRARLMDFSMSVHTGTTRPQKFLKNDGSISTEVVKSVRVAAANSAKLDKTLSNGTKFLTLTSFLSANAIRAADSMADIDWCTSNNSTPCALRQVTVPILITAMGGHYFIADNETHYDVAASRDKDFIVIEGAVHGQTPCEACSKVTGQSYSNATKNLYDYVAKWANARFK